MGLRIGKPEVLDDAICFVNRKNTPTAPIRFKLVLEIALPASHRAAPLAAVFHVAFRNCFLIDAVPDAAVHAVWESFNNTADGFSVNEAEMIAICQCLQEVLDFDRAAMAAETRRMFRLLDTDEVRTDSNAVCMHTCGYKCPRSLHSPSGG